MSTVTVDLELPEDWQTLRLPPVLHDRLQELLDTQDREGSLDDRDRKEAEALTELVDMLALIKLRAEAAQKRSA